VTGWRCYAWAAVVWPVVAWHMCRRAVGRGMFRVGDTLIRVSYDLTEPAPDDPIPHRVPRRRCPECGAVDVMWRLRW
jgi:hypothetical protein